MSLINKISILWRIIDLQADVIDAYKEIVARSQAEEELEMLKLEKVINKISVLRESVGGEP